MFNGFKNIYNKIKNLNKSIDDYKDESVVQSLPTVAYVNRAKNLGRMMIASTMAAMIEQTSTPPAAQSLARFASS